MIVYFVEINFLWILLSFLSIIFMKFYIATCMVFKV